MTGLRLRIIRKHSKFVRCVLDSGEDSLNSSQRSSGGGSRSKLVWREAISRGGGTHGKPATVHHPATVTLIVGRQGKPISPIIKIKANRWPTRTGGEIKIKVKWNGETHHFSGSVELGINANTDHSSGFIFAHLLVAFAFPPASERTVNFNFNHRTPRKYTFLQCGHFNFQSAVTAQNAET